MACLRRLIGTAMYWVFRPAFERQKEIERRAALVLAQKTAADAAEWIRSGRWTTDSFLLGRTSADTTESSTSRPPSSRPQQE